jgi:hypothetical protein
LATTPPAIVAYLYSNVEAAKKLNLLANKLYARSEKCGTFLTAVLSEV